MTIHAFDAAFLDAQFGRSDSVRYLAEYLGELKALSAIVEGHYVDRHFLDDFAQYYAKSFNAPVAHCRRVHFFSQLDAAHLEALLAQAYRSVDEREAAERRLQEDKAYLGFVVRRPLVAATVGRTVLRTYPAEGRRHYDVVRPYVVNLAGLRLEVEGLAYQQQDRGAAVCASTALWSALQRVAHVSGHRTPTPAAITRAAGSPYPASHGLNEIQMAAALSALGYSAEYFVPDENPALFRAKLISCLQSRLPVILLVTTTVETGAGETEVGHAITVTGYGDLPHVARVPAPIKGVDPMPLRSGSVEVIYVHDDNLGSHAHYELFETSTLSGADATWSRTMRPGGSLLRRHRIRKQMLRRGRTRTVSSGWWDADIWNVQGALVPKPTNLRLPIASLFSVLIEIRPVFAMTIPAIDLHYDAKYTTGVEYKRSLFSHSLDPSRLRNFLANLALPRHVGVISAHAGRQHLVDALFDVSEVERDPLRPSLLALVGLGVPTPSLTAIFLQSVAKRLRLPVITGP